MIRIFKIGIFVVAYIKIEKMCVIEGIESVIDDGRSRVSATQFIFDAYLWSFYFETCVIDDKRRTRLACVQMHTNKKMHLVRSVPRVFKNICHVTRYRSRER